jgi:predicted phosphodiesterase
MTTISAPIFSPDLLRKHEASPYQQFRRNPALFIARWIYSRKPTISPSPPSPDHRPINIICISDAHNSTPSVPDGDILLHAGDLSGKGTFAELQSQLTWLNTLPHKHKIIIAGNHDLLLDPEFVDHFPERITEHEGAARADLDWGEVILLNNTSVTLTVHGRSITIFGSPSTPQFGNWAFQYPPIRDVWSGTIPQETDVLLTHGPPKGHLDQQGKGCGWLGRELWRTKPRLVVFGHIHEGRGREDVRWDYIQRVYDGVQSGEKGLMSVLGMAVVFGVRKAWYGVCGRRKMGTATLVNAAVVGGWGNFETYPAVVVAI